MKKFLYVILAAATVATACAKEEVSDVREEPAVSSDYLFSGSIIQPNGLNTKTTLVGDQTDRVSIAWEKGDEIVVETNDVNAYPRSYRFFADKAGTEVYFGCTSDNVSSVSTWLLANDSFGYTAYYPAYTYESDLSYFDCKASGNVNQASLQNMPLKAVLNSVSMPSHAGRKLSFSSPYAIFKFTVPAGKGICKMVVNADDNNGINENKIVTNIQELEVPGQNTVEFYVPVHAYKTATDYVNYKSLSFKAYDGSDTPKLIATMESYAGSTGDVAFAGIDVAPNTIYYFDFCNTLTISEAGTYKLVNNGIDYKINISTAIDGEVTIKYADGEGTHPANISINARGHKIDNLVVNTPQSHVEVSNGEAITAQSITSNSTFVVKSDFAITGLTVEKGSVVVEGTSEKKANVATITIPSDVDEQIKIDVTGVYANGDDRVHIVNQSSKENVVVVVEEKDKEYYVDQQGSDVTPVSKDVVATIGTTGYETLAAAVEAVQTGETITLIKDVELESVISTGAKTFTLTLNANITPKTGWNGGQTLVDVNRGGSLTINGTGKISNNGIPGAYAAVRMTGKNESGDGAVAKLTVDGSVTLEGYYYGIVGNGTRHNTEITVKGGIIKGTYPDDNIGIFHPQSGTLTINGGTIEGSTGIVLKGGKLVVNDGEIIGNGQKGDFEHNGSGWNQTGDALAVEVCDYPGQPLTVEIKGGKFSSPNAEAVASYAQNDSYTPLKGFIYGGTFSSDPWKYCAKGYASIEQGGKWVIVNAPKADVVRVHPDPDMSQEIPETILQTLGSNLFYNSESQTPAGIPIPLKDDNGRLKLVQDYCKVYDMSKGLFNAELLYDISGLDVCYIFAAKVSNDAEYQFGEWKADFVVSFDKDVKANDLGLWGFYASFGSLAFPVYMDVAAGEEVELLGTAFPGEDGHSQFDYNFIKNTVKVFPCGAFTLNQNIKGTTMKVDLRIYDPDNSEKYIVIESYEYKFNNDTSAKIDEPAQGIATQEEFVAACAAAKSGDKLVLGNGEFAIGPVDINGKTLTFKGQGAANTKIYIGNGSYDGNGGHGSNKTANMTFEDVTLDDLASDQGYLTGFTEAAGLTFRNVTFNVGFSNWGNKGGDVSFYNCTFNQNTDGKYNVQELRSANNTHYLFDGCTFNSAPGRFINAYKQGGESASIEIIVKDCSFSGTTQSKAALNLKSNLSNGCVITLYLLGNNTTNNVKSGSKTGDPLFDDNGTNATVYQGTDKDSASIIWQKGAKVEN